MIDIIANPPPDLIISLAVDTANRGPCAKSKRGVVIYGYDPYGRETPTVYGCAFNSQPWPFECDGSDACKAACGRVCVHAEQRAIFQMLEPSTWFAHDRVVHGSLALVHVKVTDGKLVPSPKGPSCDACSKLIVESKWIGRVWLYEAENSWCGYDPIAFHSRTLVNCELPVIL